MRSVDLMMTHLNVDGISPRSGLASRSDQQVAVVVFGDALHLLHRKRIDNIDRLRAQHCDVGLSCTNLCVFEGGERGG